MNRPGEFFHEFADRFDTIYDGKRNRFMRWVDRRFRSDMFARFTKTFALLGELSERTVLDVGCGSGPYALEALRRGASNVTALDAAPRMLELTDVRLAAAGVRERAKLVQGVFPAAASQLGMKYDYAIVMGVMDYVADAEAFVSALANQVTHGAALSFPSVHWFRTPLRKMRYRLRRCPLYFYDEQKIRRLLLDGGFRQVEVTKLPGAGMDYVAWARP